MTSQVVYNLSRCPGGLDKDPFLSSIEIMTQKIYGKGGLGSQDINIWHHKCQSMSQTKISSIPKDSKGVRRHHQKHELIDKVITNPPLGQKVKHCFYHPTKLQRQNQLAADGVGLLSLRQNLG